MMTPFSDRPARITLGDSTFATPTGWTAATLKDSKFVAMYPSQDKAAVIHLREVRRPAGALRSTPRPLHPSRVR